MHPLQHPRSSALVTARMTGGVLALVAVVAGFVGAMSGMGGGVVLIPILTLCGVEIKRAIALSVLAMVAVSNTAAAVYVPRHLPNLKAGAYLEVFAVIGSLVGASMTIASGQRPLFLLCGSLILVSGAALWRHRTPWGKSTTAQDALSAQLGFAGSYYDYAEKRTVSYHGRRAVLAGPLMFGAGLISVWLGIGSSALTAIIDDLVTELPTKVSLTTSHLIIGVMALAGASEYLETGLIDLKLAVPVILGVPFGALLGSKLLVGMTNRAVRAVFFIVLLVLGSEMLLRALRGG